MISTRFRPLIGVNFFKLVAGAKPNEMFESFRPLIGVNFCKLSHLVYLN